MRVDGTISGSEELQEEHEKILSLKSGEFKSNKGEKIVKGITKIKIDESTV